MVTYNGSGVDGATVTFAPASGSGDASIGVTDAHGTFTLRTTWGADGAVPGKYKATVVKTQGGATASDDGAEVEMVIEDEGSAKPSATTDALPAKYASTETTDLEYEVTAGGGDFKLELTD